jgi:hypothetical protein
MAEKGLRSGLPAGRSARNAPTAPDVFADLTAVETWPSAIDGFGGGWAFRYPRSGQVFQFGSGRHHQMTDEATEREFRRVADTFIDLANEHIKSVAKENVGMALLFAASRFNAFVVASHSKTLEDYDGEHDKAVEFFSAEYVKMLKENMVDYRRAYEAPAEQSDETDQH